MITQKINIKSLKYLIYFFRDNSDEIIFKIITRLEEKKNEKCVGSKWKLNGFVHFSLNRAKPLLINILFLTLDVNKALIEASSNGENEKFFQIVNEKEMFHKLIKQDENEGVFSKDGQNQNYDMFKTKFRGILFDFERELYWSFKDRNRVYVLDRNNSAKQICDMLWFRVFLEFLNKMIEKDLYKLTEDYRKIVKWLIGYFYNSIKNPEGLFNLNLNKNYKEKAKNILEQKVKKFVKDYINEQIVIVLDQENDEKNLEV